jgi:heme/copper-type cytochrome/quinol oxidase subunit 2
VTPKAGSPIEFAIGFGIFLVLFAVLVFFVVRFVVRQSRRTPGAKPPGASTSDRLRPPRRGGSPR